VTNLIRFCVALALLLLVAEPAGAACMQFQENRLGDAYLVNTCSLDMNVAYGLTSGDDWTPGDSSLVRIHVAADETKLLWTESNRPNGGMYKIKVYSCVAPTTLIYSPGSRPTCQISYADAG
jgi:hypothetical protein